MQVDSQRALGRSTLSTQQEGDCPSMSPLAGCAMLYLEVTGFIMNQ